MKKKWQPYVKAASCPAAKKSGSKSNHGRRVIRQPLVHSILDEKYSNIPQKLHTLYFNFENE